MFSNNIFTELFDFRHLHLFGGGQWVSGGGRHLVSLWHESPRTINRAEILVALGSVTLQRPWTREEGGREEGPRRSEWEGKRKVRQHWGQPLWGREALTPSNSVALPQLCTGITWMADSDHVCESPPNGAWLRGGVSVEPTWVFLGFNAQYWEIAPNPLKSLYIVCPLTKLYRCLQLDSLITTYWSNFSTLYTRKLKPRDTEKLTGNHTATGLQSHLCDFQ